MIKSNWVIHPKFTLHILVSIITFMQIGFAEFGGGYAGAGYRYGSDARGISLGNAMVAEMNRGFHQFGNPALLIFTSKKEGGLSFMSMSLDRSIQAAVINFELPPGAAAGLAFFRTATRNIQGRDLMGFPTETFSASDKLAMLSFTRSFTKRFSTGLSLKAVFSSLPGGLDAKGIAFDLGMIYNFSELITVGGKIENISGRKTWKFDSGATDTENFVPILSIGTSTNIHPFRLKLLFQSDTFLIPDHGNETKMKAGAEFQASPIVLLRAGLTGHKLTAGFGLNLMTKNGVKLNIDYAVDPGFENEGVSHIYSLWINI